MNRESMRCQPVQKAPPASPRWFPWRRYGVTGVAHPRSLSAACGIGLFWAFIPLPSQMLPAAATAMTLRANVPLTLAWVWVANPLTMPPMFYFNYRLGAWLLHQPQRNWTFEWSWTWLRGELAAIGPPLYLGSVVAGAVAALAGYALVRALGRWRTARRWRSRAARGRA